MLSTDEEARLIEEFLLSDSDYYNYRHDVSRLLRTDQTRLIVNIDHLRDYNRAFADALLKEPSDYLPAVESALLDVVKIIHDPDKQQVAERAYHVGFCGSFGEFSVSPRTLRASHLNSMLSIEGIVTRCSLVRPKMLRSVHYCPETRQFLQREYRDATSATSNQPPTSSLTPQTDDAIQHALFRIDRTGDVEGTNNPAVATALQQHLVVGHIERLLADEVDEAAGRALTVQDGGWPLEHLQPVLAGDVFAPYARQRDERLGHR